MPTPDRTSLEAIIEAARDLLEQDGLTGLTMQVVADRVGVRAPSLYKRVESRDKLIQLVAEATLVDLAERLDTAPGFVEFAHAFRAFAHERPAAFQLSMSPGAGVPTARLEFGIAASAPILRLATTLAGDENSLEAARTMTAWAVGFVTMELNGGFNLGGDVDDAWNFGVARIMQAMMSQAN